MHYPATTSAPYVAPPDVLRLRAVTRRASVSDAVARAVADLAFGCPDRDRTPILPVFLAGKV